MNFTLELDDRRLRFACPRQWMDAARIAEVADGMGIRAGFDDVDEKTARVDLLPLDGVDVSNLFADVHGYPRTPRVDLADWRPSSRPRMSCVVLHTCNDQFVRRHQLPSLMQSVAGQDAEIIVVYNGPANVPLPEFGGIRVIRSDFAAVARGYNAGVEASSGEYVAIFHDDVLLWDSHWIDKCVAALTTDVVAVSPEVQHSTIGPSIPLPVAKGVPLVMRRRDYDRLGGHDPFFLAGIEDLDLSHRILAEGSKIQQIELDSIHFNGMSTIIGFGGDPVLFRRIFGHHLLGRTAIRTIQGTILSQRQQDPQFHPLSACYMQHFLQKYQRSPGALDVSAIAERCSARACTVDEKEALEERVRAGFSAAVFTPIDAISSVG